jgi:hypothetical protein
MTVQAEPSFIHINGIAAEWNRHFATDAPRIFQLLHGAVHAVHIAADEALRGQRSVRRTMRLIV